MSTKVSTNKNRVVYKYSNKGKGCLREAVFIDGIPSFIKYQYNDKSKKDYILQEPIIEEATRTLVPPWEEHYPYEPYRFDSRELNYLLSEVKHETIDTLYEKIKSVIRKYIDVNKETINLLSADVLGSYFQDRFSTVHYIVVVGDNGTGKSAIADVFEALGYRAIVMTNPTRAIWYRVLGDIEYGQVTIIADESEGIDESPEIMSVLKDGYQTKHKVPRMDSDNKNPEWYYPFCFKIIICESSPSEYKAKGLLDRSFKIHTYKGFPEYDIKEIRNPQGNQSRQNKLFEINYLRKLLLIFKLYYKVTLPEIDIGLDGRDKELCKPLIQLFYNSKSEKEIERTLQYFVDLKNQRRLQSLEAQIYPIVIKAVSQYGNKILSRDLWELITQNLDGELDEKNPRIFYDVDCGKIYMNRVTQIVRDKFGATYKPQRKGSSLLTFNKESLEKMDKIYGTGKKIETTLVPCEPCMSSETPWKDTAPSYSLKPSEKIIKIPCLSTPLSRNRTDINGISVTESSVYFQNASHEPHESQSYPPDCYYCSQVFDGIGVELYKKHVIQKHFKMPCFPGKSDIELYSLTAKGMSWEV